MIYLRMTGGIGNQLFQYCAARKLSKLVNQEITIINNWYKKQENSYRYLLIDKLFKVNVEYSKNYSGYSYCQNERDLLEFKVLDRDNYVLDGYFINKYYLSELPQIKEEFKKNLINYDSDTLGIHIRRGDYKRFPKIYKLLGNSYYSNALNEFNNIRNKIVFIENSSELSGLTCLTNYQIDDSKDDLMSFIKLSSIPNKILANSTFSLWAAILGNNKTVVVPDNWYHIDSKNKSNRSFYDQTWKIIHE